VTAASARIVAVVRSRSYMGRTIVRSEYNGRWFRVVTGAQQGCIVTALCNNDRLAIEEDHRQKCWSHHVVSRCRATSVRLGFCRWYCIHHSL